MGHLDEYDTFEVLGKDSSEPVGYNNIRVHLVYYVNNYGRHKSRLVADGHLTYIPVESTYSGFVSLLGI